MHDALETLLAGLAHHRAGRLGEAQACYAAVPAGDPQHGRALRYRGLAALAAGDPASACVWLRRAAELLPGDVGTLVALARALLACRRAGEARDAAFCAIAHDPGAAEAWFLRGTAASALGEAEAAVGCLRRAVALAPGHASAHLNLGNALADLDRIAAAEAAMRQACDLAPGLAEAHASLGWLLAGLGRLEEAKRACRAALALRPDFAQAHWNLSFAQLLGGEFEEGWREYEWRKRHDRFAPDFSPLPGAEWQGETLAGRTLLVRAEQGLGDTIQLARFLPVLAERGARVVLACDRRLAGLLGRVAGVARVVVRGEPAPEYDRWVDQMSLPRLLGLRVETIPAAEGYLRADPERAAAWDAMLPPKPRIGLVWAGNPGHSNDARRSMPTAALAPIIAAAGASASLVSLQVGPRSREIATLHGIADRSASLADFEATAALVAGLDLVIAVDTSTAHLAGALGVPVWVMLPSAPDWRWMVGRGDTPWYRAMRLFRQTSPGDWSGPVAAVAEGVAAWCRARARHGPCGFSPARPEWSPAPARPAGGRAGSAGAGPGSPRSRRTPGSPASRRTAAPGS